jgi:plastocyanin
MLLMSGVVLQLAAPPAAVAAPAVLTIGVDNTTPSSCATAPKGTLPPACHNFEYTHFFPNGLAATITVHQGDVVGFVGSQGSPDAFHTATLLKTGETGVTGQVTSFTEFPLAVTDTDTGDAPGQMMLNPQIFFPSNPSCGLSAANPCPYDGTADINSGAMFPGGLPGLYAQINTPTGTVVPFVCLIHFGMRGQLQVVDSSVTSTTQADLNTQGTAEYTSETANALAREAALNAGPATTTVNPNGTTNWTLTAGADGANNDAGVQVMEMLPSSITIKPGDTVNWTSPSTREIHTVTFPHSDGLIRGNPAYNAFPFVCEGPSGDTQLTGPPAPPNLGCPGPPTSTTGFELHGNFAPVGPTTIATPVTLSTSGIIANFPLGPPTSTVVSTTAAYAFPNQNSFSYQCTVHDNMFGVVNVVGAPGYREVANDGGIFSFGSSGFYGSTGSIKLNKPIVGGAATPSGKGYWAVATDGGIFAYGDAGFFGSAGSLKLNQPIVGMAPTPDGGGYWLFASDGGIFSYGDAGFFGSAGSIKLNKPIVGGAPSPDGLGYTMVATDGGIFNYGDAGFYGSAGSITLNKPVVGMAPTPSGGGYWLVATDGGIFNYGDAGFFGSAGSIKLNQPVVGIGSTIDGLGYNLVATDGGLFTYGDAKFIGSMGGTRLNKPVVGLLR